MSDVDKTVKESLERVHARVQRTNRVMYLAGQLAPAELEGLILLLEELVRDRRPLADMTPERAIEGVAYMLPAGAF